MFLGCCGEARGYETSDAFGTQGFSDAAKLMVTVTASAHAGSFMKTESTPEEFCRSEQKAIKPWIC
jgi:hypothetical protein